MRPIRIADAADERLADYRLLNDHAARRQFEGDEFFIAEGFVAIDRVVDSGHELRSVLLLESRVDRFVRERPELEQTDIPIYIVPPDVLATVAGFDLHRGVVASARRRALWSVATLAAAANTLVALEGLNDPENVGIIARTARALGADGLLLDPSCTDPYARRTVRVSMGEVLHLPVARSSAWPDDLRVLHEHGIETWAMTPADDAEDLWQIDVPDRLAIVLGAEGPGLDRHTIDDATRCVRIPIRADVDSLNVGHAAAIALAAVARRRPGRPQRA